MTTQPLADLGEWIAQVPAEEIPAAALTVAQAAIVDCVGVTMAARNGTIADALAAYRSEANAPGSATIIGRTQRTSAELAAFTNAAVGHALDFDDYGESMGGHPTVVIFPAALALAEQVSHSGRDLLEACVIGYEAVGVLGRSVNMRHYELGWHPTSTLGVFGAAAAAARILGLDPAYSEATLTIAASLASGIKGNFGTPAKALHAGHAARSGVAAALLARSGLHGAPGVLAGHQGFAEVYQRNEGVNWSEFDRLGQFWDVLERGLAVKIYPSCASTHAPVEAALKLRDDLPSDRIAAIDVRLDTRRLRHTDRPVVRTGFDAKFSLQYTVAVAFIDGAPTLAHFADDAIRRPEIDRLMRSVSVSAGEASERDSQRAEVTVRLDDGTRRTAVVDAPRGSPHGPPLDPHEMQEKFVECCVAGGIDRTRAAEVFEQVSLIDQLDDVRGLGAALRM